jgi:hypothetical protein
MQKKIILFLIVITFSLIINLWAEGFDKDLVQNIIKSFPSQVEFDTVNFAERNENLLQITFTYPDTIKLDINDYMNKFRSWNKFQDIVIIAAGRYPEKERVYYTLEFKLNEGIKKNESTEISNTADTHAEKTHYKYINRNSTAKKPIDSILFWVYWILWVIFYIITLGIIFIGKKNNPNNMGWNLLILSELLTLILHTSDVFLNYFFVYRFCWRIIIPIVMICSLRGLYLIAVNRNRERA